MKEKQNLYGNREDLTHEGLGVGKVDGLLFIENSIPGEVVRVKTMKVEKLCACGGVAGVSPNRVEG